MERGPAWMRHARELQSAQSGAVTAMPGVVFSGSVDGHLRAYRSDTGEVVWDFDTVREYDAVNGGKARGGSLDGGGPAVVGAMVYVNSGYGTFGGTAGQCPACVFGGREVTQR